MARSRCVRIVAAAISLVGWAGGLLWAQGSARPMECSGTVVDFRAQAVSGAEVLCLQQVYDYAAGCIRWNVLARTATDAQGRFHASGQAANLEYFWVAVRKPGLSIGWYGSRYAGPARELNLFLSEPMAFDGTVVDENGQGVPDATVGVCLNLPSMGQWPFEDPQGWCTSRTDREGKFRLEHVPAGATADFRVEAPGKAVHWTHWDKDASKGMQYRAGKEAIRIALKPEAVIRGRVIDETSGKPVAGVQLLARPDNRHANYSCFAPVTSAPDGTFSYKGLQADVYSLQIVAPQYRMLDWVGKDVKVTAQAGRTADVTVPVGKGGLVEVAVLDAATGSPIENARVTVDQKATYSPFFAFSGVFCTDARGVALARAPAGECRVGMVGDTYEYFSDPEPVKVVKGQTVRRQRSLDAFPSIAGIVHDPNGRPARGVIVCSRPACDRASASDAQGRFQVTWRPNPRLRTMLIMARDPERNLVGLAEVNDWSQPADVTLAPALTVRGRVADPNGKPIPAAQVQLKGRMPGWHVDAVPAVLTDAQGIYEIRAVPAPREYLRYGLQFQAEGYGPIRGDELSFASTQGMRVEAPSMILVPTDKSISGVVVTAAGRPAAGASVSIYGPHGNAMDGQPGRQTKTDAQGRFTIEGVCAGPLQVRAGAGNRPGDSGQLDARGGDRNVKIVLGRSGVHVEINSLLGKPLPDTMSMLDRPSAQMQGKPILLCFFDMSQRSSRNGIDTLAKWSDALRQKGVTVAAIQAAPVPEDAWMGWIANQGARFSFGRIKDDTEKVQSAWGVQSLPWLILADKSHIVRAEGFQLGEIDGILARVTETQK